MLSATIADTLQSVYLAEPCRESGTLYLRSHFRPGFNGLQAADWCAATSGNRKPAIKPDLPVGRVSACYMALLFKCLYITAFPLR